MYFAILGRLEAHAAGRQIDLGGAAQRRVLAALLLKPNRVVPIDQLVEAVWDGEPPATAQRQVRNRIAALRVILTRHGSFIETHPAGYLLRVAPDELDTLVFDDLVAQGRQARAVMVLRRALDLWRGPVLAELATVYLRREAAGLKEKRLALLEDRIDLELDSGERPLDELRRLVADNPLRERFVGQLMRASEPSEALAVYAELATRLGNELGIDPSPEIRRIADAVRGERPAPEAPVVPQQLPADIAGFSGRASDISRLDEMQSDGQSQGAVVIAGTAGVGKTALAVHWAHRLRHKYPDGQLYVNLRGYAPTPALRPIDALSSFLRALGVHPAQVPTEVDDAAAMYRSVLAGKRVLVVLDNANSAEQVRPLLPVNPESMALVTSRDALAELVVDNGGRRITLDVLDAHEAFALLTQVLGAGCTTLEPDATAELASFCAHLPLALRIAGANAVDGEGIGAYVERLRAGNRLTDLAIHGDQQAAVRAAFDLSYAALDEPTQRMFGLLGLVPGPDFTFDAAAALADITVAAAARLLERLAAAHLIDCHKPGRFAFHDLLRIYAAERTAAELRRAALTRLYRGYVHGARAAADTIWAGPLHLPLPPGVGPNWTRLTFADRGSAGQWLTDEHANLVVAATEAARAGLPASSWLLADALRIYFVSRMYAVDLIAVARAGLAAAEAEDDSSGEAICALCLGSLYLQRSQYSEAIEFLTRAYAAAQRASWAEAQGAALGYLGSVHRRTGRVRQSIDYLTRALVIDREVGTATGQAVRLLSLGLAYKDLGSLSTALDYFVDSVKQAKLAGGSAAEANSLLNIAQVYEKMGRFDDARTQSSQVLVGMREIGDRQGETDAMQLMARLERAAGRRREALDYAEAALASARDLSLSMYEIYALTILAAVHDDLGRHDDAIAHAEMALIGDSADRLPRAEAQIVLAAAYCHAGRPEAAMEQLDDVLAMAAESEFRVLEASARTVRAEVHLAAGRTDEAVGEAHQALAIHRETGHRPGEAQTLVLLARAVPADARQHAQAARDLYTAMGAAEPADLATCLWH